MIEGYLRRLGLMDADGPVDYLDPQRMNLAKSWPTSGAIDSGLNPQMTRPVRSSFPNPADYADEPPSRIGQAIDDYRAGKRDDTGAMLASAATNVASMPLKMMTLEGMYGLGKSAYDAFMTPYRVLTSPEPVTTEQMIEPAANIALTAPLGGLAAGRMAPVELSQGKEEARGLLGLLQQSDPYGRDYLSPVGQGDMPDVIATDPRLYPTPAPAPDRNASMLERYMPQSMIEWGSSVKAAQGKPTLFGKMLGAVGLDESGRRGQTSWSDAAKSTMYLPGELVEGLIGSGRNLANYEGGAYHTSPEAADRARASQLTGDVFNVAGALPMGAAGMSAAGRMAPVERVAYSNSKEGALPGILSGAGQKQGTSATAGHPSGSGVPSLPPSDPMAGGLPGHTPSSGQPGQGGHTSLPRDPSLDAWRNSVIQDIAKRIEDADLRLDDIGLRAETGRTFKDGEYLPKSRVWDDGAPLNEELNGTSTIGLDRYTTTPEDVAGALHGLGNYEGDSLVLVGGRGKEFGVDSGEHVIRNAQSLGQWPRYKDGMQLFSNSKEAAPLSLLSQGKEEVRGLRLYRGEGANPNDKIGGGLDWSGGIGDAARGNWFTTSLDEAKGTYAGKDGKVYYVDVPHDRMGDLTNSVLFPAEHYVVPGDIAAKKQLHEALSQGKDTPQGDNTPMIARIARLLSSR